MFKIQRWWRMSLLPTGGRAASGLPAADEAVTVSAGLALCVADGELLARHAIRMRLTVDDADIVMLNNARRQPAAWADDMTAQGTFIAALRRVATASAVSIGELRALEQRARRVAQDLAHAQQLLYFAAARGRSVDDALAQPILAAAGAAEDKGMTQEQEQAFLLAYRRLAAEMAPVTAATLVASRQRLPRLGDLLTSPRHFFADLSRITLGRFLHFVLFTLVLLCAGATIAYQTVGEAAFARHRDIGERTEKLLIDQARAAALQRDSQRELFALTERKDARGDDIAAAEVRLQEAIAGLKRISQQIEDAKAERTDQMAMLNAWAGQPCRSSYVKWICGLALHDSATPPSDREIVFDAEMALRRLNVIVLPMLLGLLGAYAYVLRTITREIRERSFEENSALYHVVRLSLGALAGIAVGWFLKPEQVGLLNSVPAWVLAFVAGYGIELVFAFLDRIVAAFTTKQASP